MAGHFSAAHHPRVSIPGHLSRSWWEMQLSHNACPRLPAIAKRIRAEGPAVRTTSRAGGRSRRLRRLMRKTVENNGSASSKTGPRRRDSVPWFTTPDPLTQESNSIQQDTDGQLRTPTTGNSDQNSPGIGAIEKLSSPRPGSRLAQRQLGTVKSTISAVRESEDTAQDILVPEPLTLVPHRGGYDSRTKPQNLTDSRETPARPESARPTVAGSPQLAPVLCSQGHSHRMALEPSSLRLEVDTMVGPIDGTLAMN